MRNITGIMLAVAIDADHVLIAEFEGKFVACLHAATESEVMRQAQNMGAGESGRGQSGVGGAVIDHQHGDAGHFLMDGFDHARDRSLLVIRGYENKQFLAGNRLDGELWTHWRLLPHKGRDRGSRAGRGACPAV